MRGKHKLSVAFVCLGIAVAARPAAAEVHVTMNAGRVTVSAQNATVAQILAEWAKVGQTKIVNPERVGGGPMTLELKDVPEVEAIEIVLRSAAGYVLAPRRAESLNISRYDRILILPRSTAVTAPPRTAAAPPPPRQVAPQPRGLQLPGQIAGQPPADDPVDEPDDQADRQVPAPGGQPVRPPVFNTFPQPPPQRADTPAAPPSPTSTVTAPVGVSVPGMVVPAPQQNGQPGVAAPPQQQQR